MSSANKFLGTDSVDVTDGSLAIFGASIGAANLTGGANTVKIGSDGTLLAESILISDISGLQDQLDGGIGNPMTLDLLGGGFNISDIKSLEINNGSFGITLDYSSGITNQVFDLQTMVDIEDVTQNFNLSTTAGQTDITGDLVITGDFQFGGALVGDLVITDINFGTTQTDTLKVFEQNANFLGAMDGLNNSIGTDGLTAPPQVILMGGVNKSTGFLRQLRTDDDGRLRIRIDELGNSDIDTNTGNASNGTQRVVLASDQPTVNVSEQNADFATAMTGLSNAIGTDGVLRPSRVMLIGGVDGGANIQQFQTDTSGNQIVVIAGDQVPIGVTNPNDFINNQGTLFNDWNPLTNLKFSEEEGYWNFTSTFTSATVTERGLEIFNGGTTGSATILGDYIYPQLAGANIITLFHYIPATNGNFVGDGDNTIVLKLGFKKLMNTTHIGYSRIVIDLNNSTGGLSIEYTDVLNTFSIPSSSFNIDKLDGTGPSGVSFNVRSSHTFYIVENSLENGRYTYGFIANGRMYDMHFVDTTIGDDWFEHLTYSNIVEILLDGPTQVNSGIILFGVASYISIPFTFDTMSILAYNRSFSFGLQNIAASSLQCVCAIRYNSFNPSNSRTTFLKNISISSDQGRYELTIFRIKDNITSISAGVVQVIGDLQLTKQPTVVGPGPGSNEQIFAELGLLTNTFDLSHLSWKNLGYNGTTRILLLVFVRNITSGGGGADVYVNLDWMSL